MKPLAVVGAAVIQRRRESDSSAVSLRCLAVQRSETMNEPLAWEFPGGKVETGEDPRQALRREVMEELALEVTVGRHLGRGSGCLPADGDSNAAGRELTLDVYECRLAAAAAKPLLREHRAARWLAADELHSVRWAPADIPVLDALRKVLEEDEDGAP